MVSILIFPCVYLLSMPFLGKCLLKFCFLKNWVFCFLIDELGEFYIFWIQALHFIYMLLKCFLPVCVCLFMFLSVSFEEQSGSGKSKGWLDSVCILKVQGMLMNWMWGMRERKGSRMTSAFLTEQLKGWSLLR